MLYHGRQRERPRGRATLRRRCSEQQVSILRKAVTQNVDDGMQRVPLEEVCPDIQNGQVQLERAGDGEVVVAEDSAGLQDDALHPVNNLCFGTFTTRRRQSCSLQEILDVCDQLDLRLKGTVSPLVHKALSHLLSIIADSKPASE